MSRATILAELIVQLEEACGTRVEKSIF